MVTAAARVLHLSDLHFGAPGHAGVWSRLESFVRTDLRPDAILVTGDLVDTPRTSLFKAAAASLERLCLPYQKGQPAPCLLVCPGNHDRYVFGNRIAVSWPWGKQFEHYFGRFDARQGSVIQINDLLRLEVLSIDTTENARFFARGAVSRTTREQLRSPKTHRPDASHERSLRVLLMHHHLLPIAELEPERDGLLGPFLSATTVVANPGKVLACLSEAKYDLVLHGHEHAFNVARFDAATRDSLSIAVVGAPSSTGTVTRKGCQLSQSRFNVLEFDADETLWLSAYAFQTDSETWTRSDSRTLLMSDSDLRRAWFNRSSSRVRPDTGIRWFFDHRPNFDVHVLRTYCDLAVPTDNQFVFAVSGSPSAPDQLESRFLDADGITRQIPNVAFERDAERRNVFRARIPLHGPEPASFISRFVTQYRSPGASRSTRSRIDQLDPEDRDFFNRQGMDSVFARFQARVAWIEISLLLPLDLAPQRGLDGVVAYIQRQHEREPVRSESLTRRIVPSGDGHYSLRVPYPDVNTRYYLAWPVLDDSGGYGTRASTPHLYEPETG